MAAAAPRLPDLQGARLEYLFAAGERLARQWPELPGELPCVVLVDPAVQWLVGCEQAPDGSYVQLDERVRDRPVYARSSESVTIGGITQPTRAWILGVGATTRVEPLPARSSSSVVWVATLEAIRARPDFRECTTDEWLSVALHELMHARQLAAPAFAARLREILAGTLSPEPIRALYEQDARYRDLVQREYRLLERAALGRAEGSDARRALREWLALYRRRTASLCARPNGSALAHADSVYGYLEGVARYVESRFLVDPTLRPAHPIAGDRDFHAFVRYASGGYAAMQNRQLDREYDYALGFHLALLLDRIDPGWKQRVHAHQDLLYGLAAELAGSNATARDPAAPPRPCR